MPGRVKYTAIGMFLVFALVIGNCWGQAKTTAYSPQDYGSVLAAYVDGQGMVNYRGLKAKPNRLVSFLKQLADLDPQAYQQWRDEEKIAFWINVYNALTLKAIIDHYPIKAPVFGSARFLYPANSIRQIPGVWDKLRFPVMGRRMTLDEIEHQVLRAQFNEPRIHVALVCAAMGCPPLRNEPFVGAKLNEQLADQTRRFLKNPKKFRLDRSGRRVFLSPIFKWFGQDFVKTYGTKEKFRPFSEAERAVFNFISPYLGEQDREYLLKGNYSISYLKYDWSLNEQSGK